MNFVQSQFKKSLMLDWLMVFGYILIIPKMLSDMFVRGMVSSGMDENFVNKFSRS